MAGQNWVYNLLWTLNEGGQGKLKAKKIRYVFFLIFNLLFFCQNFFFNFSRATPDPSGILLYKIVAD